MFIYDLIRMSSLAVQTSLLARQILHLCHDGPKPFTAAAFFLRRAGIPYELEPVRQSFMRLGSLANSASGGTSYDRLKSGTRIQFDAILARARQLDSFLSGQRALPDIQSAKERCKLAIYLLETNLALLEGHALPHSLILIDSNRIREIFNSAFHDERGVLGLNLLYELRGAPVSVFANPEAFYFVAVNLASNVAIHARRPLQHPDDLPAAALCVLRSGNSLLLVLHDDGPGISLANPMDVFRDGVTTRSVREAHSGMGLAICREYVIQMGGTITASNHRKGGALFELSFPIVG